MSEKPLGMLIGARIREARTKLGIRQKDFAELIGTTQSHMSDIETGRFPDFRISTLIKVAEALGLPVGSLIDPSYAEGMGDFLLELARRNTESERRAEASAQHHWGLMDIGKATHYRGVASGLRRAQNNQLGLIAEIEVARAAVQRTSAAQHPMGARPCDEVPVSDDQAGRESPPPDDQTEAA